MLSAVRHVTRSQSNWGRKMLLAVDNLAALGAATKGRSKRQPLQQICRTIGALCLAHDLGLLIRFARSEKNHADGPSRAQALGYFCQNVERRTLYEALRDA